MPYPYPRIGSVTNPGTIRYRTFTRPTNCTPEATFSYQDIASSAIDGMGFRSAVIKSDRFHPTDYQVWWSEFIPSTEGGWCGGHGLCYGTGGNPSFSSYRSGITAYRVLGPRSMRQLSGSLPFNGALTRCTALSPFLPGLPAAELATLANNKVLLDLVNQTNQLGITIAESGKTTRYLASKLGPLVDGLVGIKQSKKRFFRFLKRSYRSMFPKGSKERSRAKQHLRSQPWDKRLASRWLEYNYAIMPLVYEVSGAMEFFETPPPLRFSIKKREKMTFQNSIIEGPFRYHYNLDLKVMVQHNCQIQDPTLHTMNRLGLTPAQFVFGTAWELIPFSFVADWALQFNDLLKGMSAYQGVTFLSGFRSVKFTAEDRNYEINGTGLLPTNQLAFGEPMKFSKSFEELAEKNPPASANCVGNRVLTSGFVRQKLSKPPSYSYSASLDFMSKRRLLTIVSLLSVLRK